MHEAISQYLEAVKQQFYSGHAVEHAYRPALQRLMESFDDTIAINDPKHSEHGAPDFVFLKKSNTAIIQGYAEAKDIDKSLDRTEKSDQMERYAGYTNLFLTDYLEFRFFNNGEKYETISLGYVKGGVLYLTPENGERLLRELAAFLELPPESIHSGKRLARIMGGKARRIRDNVEIYLRDESINAQELTKIYEMMKKLLVHDLDEEKFADMYAQTLVYGLFVARYGDDTPDNFTRSEARDLVPASNPFLRHFFDHIAGTGFDARLAKIVDELCEIFSVSDVRQIVHKHLKITESGADTKDPIIHFYEDFLQSYDPHERKRMGAYYTPTPVVKYIVSSVDAILKREFGIAKGLASTETITRTIDTQPWRKKGERKDRTTREISEPRVQILDPAVGTATFLNETIKYIYEQNFAGKQEGQWPDYANRNLVPRLFGFELMMAPYTIAHLKLGMTLRETGVDKLSSRLNVFLTNTLEEGVPQQPDLFSFGLAEAVSEESRLAAEVKSEKPVMVVMGNPPYSGVSSNETKYANELIAKYKVEPGGRQKLQERKHWLNDDYVKFIAFAEDMIAKQGSGVVAMITNNGYLDNPTFRGMRWHLAKTFDKIYVIDLHGNAKKKEVAPDGSKDENVFDIMQGVGIILAVKNDSSQNKLAEVYHADVYGKRQTKFDELDGDVEFTQVSYDEKSVYFIPKDTKGQDEYQKGVALDKLFLQNVTGIVTMGDNFIIADKPETVAERIQKLARGEYTEDQLNSEFGLGKNYAKYVLENAPKLVFDESRIVKLDYRPFDEKYTYFDNKVLWRWREKVMNNFLGHENIALAIGRMGYVVGAMPWNLVSITEHMMDFNYFYRGGEQVIPAYLYHEDGTRTPNFNATELSVLFQNMPYTLEDVRSSGAAPSSPDTVTPEDVLDYIYAVLHSPSYRAKYKEFLKIDFPRVPAPADATEFWRLVEHGRTLRHLHLMKTSLDFDSGTSELPDISDYDTTFPAAGDNTVEKITRDGDAVYINATQYFGNVPDVAWNFYIGGYQPAQKWLKDRRGRTLTYDDIDHYQKIIKVLLETDRVMKEIG